MSYTGIKEVDDVLVLLYEEQNYLEAKMREGPQDPAISERHRKVVHLINMLIKAGQVLSELDAQHLAGTPDTAGSPDVA
jgi:hypothetical protein